MTKRMAQAGEVEDDGAPLWWFGVGVFLLVPVLWLGWVVLALSTTAWSHTPEFLQLPATGETLLARRGQFGDSFGAFNALISAFGFAGLILTLIVQRKQLASQQKQNEASNRLFRQQQFQEQFYRAVDAYRSLLSDISVPDTAPGNEQRSVGRQALSVIWRTGLLSKLRTDTVEGLKAALDRQLEASSSEFMFNRQSHSDAAAAIRTLDAIVRTDDKAMKNALSSISVAWSTLYQANRFQLDALFRAWYTVYRVLHTAPRYRLDPEEIKLYSATFRAQLSWIEMAFLLTNQSALQSTSPFPRACAYSNEYQVFDNLVADDDLVVSILKSHAMASNPSSDPSRAHLTKAAFGTNRDAEKHGE